MKQTQTEKPPCIFLNTIQQYTKPFSLSIYFLRKKYSSFYYTYTHIQINNLVFNEKSHITGKFKDFLIIDDETEFLRRFYSKEENPSRLRKIYSFYETYSKIFPNYMILPESKYLYRNIRKKQRMIDAFNQIKKEEEENRLNLNIGKKNNKDGLVIFNQSIQKSIKGYELSQTGFKTNANNDETINSFSISISLKRFDQLYLTNSNNESNVSLACVIQAMNNYQDQFNDKVNVNDQLVETPKKENKKINYDTTVIPSTKIKDDKTNNERQTLSALNNNRKFISHKIAVSNPEIHNKKIQIVNNYHNIILPEGSKAIININTNYYQCPIDENNFNTINNNQKTKEKGKLKSPEVKEKTLFENIDSSIINTLRHKNNYPKNGSVSKPNNTKTIKKEVKFKEFVLTNTFKSPEKQISNCPITLGNTKTINNTNHMIPFFKNKHLSNAMTELQKKINPFKMRFAKRKEYQTSNKASISSQSLSKKTDDIHLTKKKLIVFATEGDKNISVIQTDIEPKVTKAEIRNRYKLFMDNAKKGMTLRNVCNTSKKQSTTIDTSSKRKNSKVFTSNSTQKEQQSSKITIQKKLLFSPKLYNKTNNNFNETKVSLTTKIKMTPKIIGKQDKSTTSSLRFSTNSNVKLLETTGIKRINFKALNVNTNKMKFIKK